MPIMGVTSSGSAMVQSLADMRAKLDDLQRQLGTGQLSDTYAGLGPQRALTVGLQSQLDAANGFNDTITAVGTRLSLAQDSLTAITTTGQTVRQALAASNFTLGQNGQTTDQTNAQGQLGTILAALNVQDATGYIFSGLSPDQPAVQTLDSIMNGVGSQAGFKKVLDERKQADLGTNGMGRLVISAPGAAKITGIGATITPDAPASVTGSTNISTLLSAGGNLVINGKTIVVNPSDNATTVLNAINAQSGVTGVTASLNGTNHLILTSANADTAINTTGTSAGLQAELGIAATTTNPTNLITQGAVTAAQTLTVTIGANPPLTVVFGNGPGQVSTLAELQSALLGLSGGAASVDPANGNISVTALNSTDSVTIGGTATVANFGVTTVPAAPTVGGTNFSVSEDAAGSPFGFKIAGLSTSMAGAVVSGPTGNPPGVSVNLGGNPNVGESLTLTLNLPDGSTENVVLTATTANPPGPNQFTIGANAAATAANLQSALTSSVAKLADTSLVAASAIAAANNFFDTDAGNPPQRVNGPPFGTAMSLVDGTAANTVNWYTGEAGSSSARTTAVARVDPAVTISFGMRANEVALRTAVKNVAVFSAVSFSASDPNAESQYGALTTRLAGNLDPPLGKQSLSDLSAEIANAQIMAKDAQDRHTQATATVTDFLQSIENVSPDQVGTELLTLQTSLQASLQTTAMLSKLSLVNFLPIG